MEGAFLWMKMHEKALLYVWIRIVFSKKPV